MTGPDYYLVAANAEERESLKNEQTAKQVIFLVITLAFVLSAATMLSIFWKSPQQRNAVMIALTIMLLLGALAYVRARVRFRKIKSGAEFMMIYGAITAKRQTDGAFFVAINNLEFPVGPEVYEEARLGARLAVREWYATNEFHDYTFNAARLADWLGRSKPL